MQTTINKNRMAKLVIAVLVLVIVANLDRLIFPDQTFMRQIDFSNMYLDKFIFMSKYILDPEGYSWNSLALGGWPTYLSSIQVFNIGSILSLIMDPKYVLQSYMIILFISVFCGGALFCEHVAGVPHKNALLLGSIWLCLNLFFIENPIVTATSLLPLLIAALSSAAIPRGVRLIALTIVLLFGYSPYTLPIMPILHFLTILLFWKKIKYPISDFYNLFLFWIIYSILNFPYLIGYLQFFDLSNRSEWTVSPDFSLLENPELFLKSAFSWHVWPPVFGAFFLLCYSLRYLLFAVSAIILLMIFHGALPLIENWTFLNLLSFIIARLPNSAAFLFFILLVYGSTRDYVAKPKRVLMACLAIFCWSVLLGIITGWIQALQYSILSVTMLVACWLYLKNTRGFLISILILLPLVMGYRGFYSLKYERLGHGQLYTLTGQLPITSFDLDQPFRFITAMPKYWDQTLFSAQLSTLGLETADGMSVFYSKDWSRLWKSSFDLSGMVDQVGYSFAQWNNRAEITADSLLASGESGISGLRLMNVGYIISHQPLKLDGLVRSDEYSVLIPSKSAYQKNGRLNDEIRIYVHKVENPSTRLIRLTPHREVDCELADLPYLNTTFGCINPINLDSYSPGDIRLSLKLERDEKIIMSSNFARGWFYEDDQGQLVEAGSGPLGFVTFQGNGRRIVKIFFKANYSPHVAFITAMLTLFAAVRFWKFEPSKSIVRC